MVKQNRNRPGGRSWRRLALVAAGIAVCVGAFCLVRGTLPGRARAEPAAPAAGGQPVTPRAEAAGSSDYASRVVAYVHDNEPVTRQELGEYLIARHGADKLEALVNRRLIEDACRARGLEVTAAEIETALAEDLKGLNIDRATFVSTVLGKYHKTLYEWKEDVLRPKHLLTKLCRDRVHVSDHEVQEAYESAYGEKIDCRIILWPPTPEGRKNAVAEYTAVRDSEEAFAERAKHQHSPTLSATGGKIKPIAWHTMGDDKLEQEAFKLRPGEVSTVLPTPQGYVVLKCDRRIPADTTVNLEKVRPQLAKDVLDRKVAAEMQGAFQELKKQARPQVFITRCKSGPFEGRSEGPSPEQAGPPNPRQVVAVYNNGSSTVTREELGEYLIARYGAEKIDFLVNRRIIDRACRARGVEASMAEVDAALEADLKVLNTTREEFVKSLLAKYHKTLYEWKEDVLRPKLLLTKLCRDRVHPTDEDVRAAYEAHYGEKLECRVILWPPDQAKFAMAEYGKIRDSEEEFRKKAQQQASPTLASQGGRIPAFGRHSFGDENVEREAFRLKPGEVSTLIGTPQGNVMVKLDRRIPPNTAVKLETVRAQLAREVLDKKVQIEMQVVFKELRDQANPRVMLKDPNRPMDIAAETQRILAETKLPPQGPAH